MQERDPASWEKNWLQQLRLDWPTICTVQFSPLHVFRDELGTLKDYKAVIRVDPSVLPKFCKARSLPYALQAKVDQELDRLVAEGILEPVQYAEWAAPIVPVLKSDRSVRICRDFKQTVNKATQKGLFRSIDTASFWGVFHSGNFSMSDGGSFARNSQGGCLSG